MLGFGSFILRGTRLPGICSRRPRGWIAPSSFPIVFTIILACVQAGLASDANPSQASPQPTSSGLLDGLVFSGPTGAKGMKADHHDEVLFQDGRFRSVRCETWGFSAAEYRAERQGDAIRFWAITESPTHGTLAWEGVVRGDSMEATYVWTKERLFWTTRFEYWFKGARPASGMGSVNGS